MSQHQVGGESDSAPIIEQTMSFRYCNECLVVIDKPGHEDLACARSAGPSPADVDPLFKQRSKE